MTIRQALYQGTQALGGVDTPVLDATVLLSHALGVSKERLLADLPEEMDPAALDRYEGYLGQRLRGIPVSYIRGLKEFYGLELDVSPSVLVPRPDTETLVDHVLGLIRGWGRPAVVHDTCTGTGCIAIALCKHGGVEATVSDISAEALDVCARNCLRHLGRPLGSTRSDLLDDVGGRYDVITANPPYLRDDVVLAMRAGGWPEPALALAGGPDGINYVRRLVETAPPYLQPGGWLVLETAPDQARTVGADMEKRGYAAVTIVRDLGGRDRVVAGRWGGMP